MPSDASKNKYGDMGSPRRIPLVGMKAFEGVPLNKTEKVTVGTILIIRSTHTTSKPSFSMMASR
jgi:hypothetical protein